jgi:hypothetical protein
MACLSPSRIGARGLPIRILVEGRRPDLAFEASPAARTDIASPTERRGCRADRSSCPGFLKAIWIEARGLPMMMLSDVLAARTGFGWRKQSERRARRKGQDQETDHTTAHSRLPSSASRSPLIVDEAPLHHTPSPLPFLRSGSSTTGGGQILQSMARALPGQTSPGWLCGAATGRTPPAAQECLDELVQPRWGRW